jgi:hypothetical protein
MNRSLVPSIAVVALALLAAPASAKPKIAAGGPTACGYKTVPLTVGNTWTYKADEKHQIVVKITGIGPGKDWNGKPATVIDVEELYNGRTVKTSWTCTPTGGLLVALDSFYFAGEPGGGVGVQFKETAHDKEWLPPENELTADVAWVETVKADATRPDAGGAGAQHMPAKVEVERHAQLRGTEQLQLTALGPMGATKVGFELRGRGIIDPAPAAEIPIKRPAMFWFTKGVGLVKIDDAFDRTWELVETNLIAK